MCRNMFRLSSSPLLPTCAGAFATTSSEHPSPDGPSRTSHLIAEAQIP